MNRSLSESLVNFIKKTFSTKEIVLKFLPDCQQDFEKVISNDNVKEILENGDMVNTIALFFDNNLNVSTTSKLGFMHRNTLIYRLDKIKKLTGLNIRNFEDAIILQNIITVYKMIKKI